MTRNNIQDRSSVPQLLQLMLLGALVAVTCAFTFAVALPFSREEFFSVFREYNGAVWPAQVGLTMLAVIAMALAHSRARAASRGILVILAFLWLWMGAVYHARFFAAINPAALIFAGAFILQAFLFARAAASGNTPMFDAKHDSPRMAGWAVLALGLVVYPLASAVTGHQYPAQPTFGLPCPTTIFTLGMLLWTSDGAPRYLFVVPVIWSIVATAAAIQLGVYEDLLLTLSVAVAVVARVRIHRPHHLFHELEA